MAKDGKQYAKISGTWHQIKPSYDDLTDVPTDFNPTTHTHGNMNDDGQITAEVNIATGDHLVIADHSSNNDLTTSDITFDISNTTQFLRRDGNFATPASTDGTKLPLTGGTLSGDLTLEADGTGTVSSHGIVFKSKFDGTDVPRELNLNSSGGLEIHGNEIYHEGHKPTYTELGTMAYSNLTGTPTIPTNNNQLTNGAGYISSFDITTQTDGKYLRSNANDDFSGTLNYTPDTGTILSVDGQAILQRMTANGAITIGHDDAVIIAGGDTSGVLNSNINNATETVFVGAEGGFVAYAFPSNNTAWSNRKEMNWNGTNLTLLGNNVWHAGNDGSGSGLDADTLDGSHASTFAPKASPALTGTPTAPTAAANTNTTQIATTAYVQQEISDLIGGAPLALDTLNELAAAINDDSSFASTVTTSLAGKMSTSHPANNHTSTHLYMANGDGFIWNDTTNVMSVRKDGTDYTNWDSGNLTNLNQLTNGPGYVTSSGVTSVATGSGLTGGTITGSGTISHADTSSQASVNNSGNTFIQDITLDGFGHITGITSAAASDSTKLPLAGGTMTGDLTLDHDGTGTAADSHALKFRARAANTDFEREIKLEDGGGFAFDSNILLTGDVTTTNRARMIDFTGFDKEGTTDFSDRAYIQHTTNTGGHSGSVLVISSQNDSTDGIAFQTNASSKLKHNGNNLATESFVTSQGYITTDTNTVTNLRANSGTYRNGNLSLVNGNNVTITETSTGVFSIAATDTNTNTQLSNEQVQDIVGAMVSGNSETGISVTYQDADGTLDFALTKDPTITLNGDVSGAATMTDLNSVTISTTVANDSHTHDGRYYTESEMDTFLAGKSDSSHNHDSRYYTETEVNNLLDDKRDANQTITLTGDVSGSGTTSIAVTVNDDSHNHTIANVDGLQTSLNGKLSTTAAAAAVSYVTSCPTAVNNTGMKVYVGSTDCSTKYSGWLYLVT